MSNRQQLNHRRRAILYTIGMVLEESLQSIGQGAVDDITSNLLKCTDDQAESLLNEVISNPYEFLTPYTENMSYEFDELANSPEGAAMLKHALADAETLVNDPDIKVILPEDEGDDSGNLQ